MNLKLTRMASAVALAVMGVGAVGIAHAGAIISNGTVQLGVQDFGNLNQPGGSSSNGDGTTIVGLRSVTTNSDSTSPGCTCEGWGVGLVSSGLNGFASGDSGTSSNLSLVSFASTASTAVSVVDILGGPTGTTAMLRVTHNYRPSAGTPYLYQVDVSIQNLTGAAFAAGDLVYRRVMDWDIPTPSLESVTIQGVPAELGLGATTPNNIRRTDNNGFNSGNPFSFTSYGLQNTNFTNSQNGNLQGSISSDQGALFDFEFEALGAGETRSFATFYGAAPDVAAADLARSLVDGDPTDVEIGLYSYGTCTRGLSGFTCDPIGGAPNTFIFGFGAAGGRLDPPPDPGTVPVPGTLALLGLGLAAIGGLRRVRS